MIPVQVIDKVFGSQCRQRCMWYAKAFIKVFSFLERGQVQLNVFCCACACCDIGLVMSAAFPGMAQCAFHGPRSLMVVPREIKFGHFC